jgi:steroid delta-isomerase-like uncharacterized protein
MIKQIARPTAVALALLLAACSDDAAAPTASAASGRSPSLAEAPASEQMAHRPTKELLRRFYEEVFNQGNLAVVDSLVAPDVVDHDLPAGMPGGSAGAKLLFAGFRQAFPDLHLTVEDVIVEANRAVARGTMTGTHRGTFLGVPPTGRRFSIHWIDVYRIEGGLIRETWHLEDFLGMLVQLGAVPAPAQGS